jgi:hypothetical protein
MSRQSHYDWLETDPEYPALFAQAKEKAVATLEAEARHRAIKGVQKVVTHQGRVVMVPVDKDGKVVPKESAAFVGEVPLIEHEYSDTLLIFLMKVADPQKYARFERPTAMTLIQNNIQAGPEEITLTIPPPKVIGRD